MLWGDLDIWSGSIGLREGPEIWHKWKFDFKKHPNKDWWTLNEEIDRLSGIEVDRMNVISWTPVVGAMQSSWCFLCVSQTRNWEILLLVIVWGSVYKLPVIY
jgi:hypothetical protein